MKNALLSGVVLALLFIATWITFPIVNNYILDLSHNEQLVRMEGPQTISTWAILFGLGLLTSLIGNAIVRRIEFYTGGPVIYKLEKHNSEVIPNETKSKRDV